MTAALLLLCALTVGPPPPFLQAPAAPAAALTSVKRIYVESFGTDADSRQIQAIVVTALVDSKRFVVTENKDRADAILRGEAVEHRSQEVHAYNEGTGVGVGGAAAVVNSGGAAAVASGESLKANDSTLDTETVTDASVSIRLVSSDGDVLWATTQHSPGGKYEGAGASAAHACVKDLLRAAH
jgi:curli biogenesis system outer membrane secretion channel CsgG